jgi:hypothetical protein
MRIIRTEKTIAKQLGTDKLRSILKGLHYVDTLLKKVICLLNTFSYRYRWPSHHRGWAAASRLHVWMQQKLWIFVSFFCCFLYRQGPLRQADHRSEESYRVYMCVCVSNSVWSGNLKQYGLDSIWGVPPPDKNYRTNKFGKIFYQSAWITS